MIGRLTHPTTHVPSTSTTAKRWMSEVAEGPVKDGRVLQVIGAVVDVEVRGAVRPISDDDDDCLVLVAAA